MIEISIPDFGDIRIRHLVLDYNGTLACDGKLLDGVKEELVHLSESLEIHVLTAEDGYQAAQKGYRWVRDGQRIVKLQGTAREIGAHPEVIEAYLGETIAEMT